LHHCQLLGLRGGFGVQTSDLFLLRNGALFQPGELAIADFARVPEFAHLGIKQAQLRPHRRGGFIDRLIRVREQCLQIGDPTLSGFLLAL